MQHAFQQTSQPMVSDWMNRRLSFGLGCYGPNELLAANTYAEQKISVQEDDPYLPRCMKIRCWGVLSLCREVRAVVSNSGLAGHCIKTPHLHVCFAAMCGLNVRCTGPSAHKGSCLLASLPCSRWHCFTFIPKTGKSGGQHRARGFRFLISSVQHSQAVQDLSHSVHGVQRLICISGCSELLHLCMHIEPALWLLHEQSLLSTRKN